MKQLLFTLSFALSVLVLSLFVSWQLLAKIDFAYPQAYQLIDIEHNISYYGPRNRFRSHFALTNSTEHYRLFAAINTAVHHQGKGLADITYHHPDGQALAKLLHQAEIVHLQDVANLLDVLWWVGIAALFMVVLMVVLVRGVYPFDFVVVSVGKQLRVLLSVLFLLALLVWLVGAERVFNAMHVWAFPDDHQWYFYYQDSLMSTLMKAPDLFAVIAVEIVLLATAIFAVVVYVAQYVAQKQPLMTKPPLDS